MEGSNHREYRTTYLRFTTGTREREASFVVAVVVDVPGLLRSRLPSPETPVRLPTSAPANEVTNLTITIYDYLLLQDKVFLQLLAAAVHSLDVFKRGSDISFARSI